MQEIVGHRSAVNSVLLLDSDRVYVSFPLPGARDVLTYVDHHCRLASGSSDFYVHLYEIATLRRVARMYFGASILAMAVDPRNFMLYVAGNDYVIKVCADVSLKSCDEYRC